MISKKNLSPTQRAALAIIDTAEELAKYVPALLTAGAIALTAVFIQKEINRKVEETCPKEISVIVRQPTAIGPSYQCISRAQLQGPAPAMKP